jgi:hypothetical protein
VENYRSLLEIGAYDDDFALEELFGGRAAGKVLVRSKEVKAGRHAANVPPARSYDLAESQRLDTCSDSFSASVEEELS